MDRTLTVELPGRSYPIHIRGGALATAGSLIAETLGAGTRCLIIADEAVAAHHGSDLEQSLRSADIPYAMVTFAGGEPHKSLTTAEQLWQAAADMRLDRQGAVIALGGGVTGDLAGFVAATWMRGLRLVQIPTTLLAMVDSSVGGKTGVNSTAGKNLIGAFHQPSLVVIDPQVLQTMAPREYAAGLAEVVKYGVIRDPEFFAWQEAHAADLRAASPAAVIEAVYRSCAIKAWYVVNDEHENGVRAHLNYGHTFGHALEGETAYQRYLHGEAVAIGMRMAAAAAAHLGMLADPQLPARQNDLLAALGLPLDHRPVDEQEIERLIGRCRIDKKVSAGRTRFVLPRSLGTVEVVSDPDPAAIRQGFAAGLATNSARGLAIDSAPLSEQSRIGSVGNQRS